MIADTHKLFLLSFRAFPFEVVSIEANITHTKTPTQKAVFSTS